MRGAYLTLQLSDLCLQLLVTQHDLLGVAEQVGGTRSVDTQLRHACLQQHHAVVDQHLDLLIQLQRSTLQLLVPLLNTNSQRQVVTPPTQGSKVSVRLC